MQPMRIDHLPMRGVAIPPFYAGQIGAQAAQRARHGLEVISMHFGQPSEGASPAALSAARAHLEGYLEGPAGYWESAALRERIALHYREQHDVNVAPERILLTTGASAGLVATFTALFAAGDRVALARPGYPAYRNALRALGRVPVEIDCGAEHGFRLAPELLPSANEPLHGLLVASPANPTGSVLSGPELAALAAECRRRGTRLVSDEIYHGVEYGRQGVTALQVEPEALVINSFSKLFRMPGWRIGWLVAPESCVAALHSHLINFFLTPPAIAQHAALAAFDDLALLKRSVETYASNRARLLEALPTMGLTGIAPPEGAFYLYVDVSHLTHDSLAFCKELLDDTGIATAPGIDFDPVLGNGFVRLSFAISEREIDRAIALLRPWLARRGQSTRGSPGR
jgi:aspartate/methionine/tyrosine aminotransferase